MSLENYIFTLKGRKKASKKAVKTKPWKGFTACSNIYFHLTPSHLLWL